jgi:hypothetical protein
VCIGRTILSNGFLYDPLAIFPCPDHRSVVCVSWPDTYEAAFTIDFSQRPAGGAEIPDRLHGIVVDSSDFEVRACTTTEVSFVKKFIRTSDLKTFASCTRWGNSGANEDSRLVMLRFLMMATSPPDWRDPLLNFKEASPLLMAQYSSAEESKQ